MDKFKLSSNVGVLIFNAAVVFVTGSAVLRAVGERSFVVAAVLAILAATFLTGIVLALSGHPLAATMNRRLCATGIYLNSALPIALEIDTLMDIAELQGRPISGLDRWFLIGSLVGTAILGMSSLVALIRLRTAHVAAVIGSAVVFPYVVMLAKGMPWNDFVFLVTYHWNGRAEIWAVFGFALAAGFATFQVCRKDKPPTLIPVNAAD